MSLEFMKAVFNNEVAKVQQLLTSSETEVNYKHKSKGLEGHVTPLHLAASMGRLEIVKILLSEKKVDKDAITDFNSTALHLAASSGHLEICRLLLPVCRITALDKGKKTAYDIAKDRIHTNPGEKQKFEEILDLLRIPTLGEACATGNLELTKEMIQKENADPNGYWYDETPLNAACINLKEDIIDYLLTLPDIRIDKPSASDQITPLFLISRPNKTIYPNDDNLYILATREQLARTLIKHGANVHARDENQQTPIVHAIIANRLGVVKALVENGTDLSIRYPLDYVKSGKGMTMDVFELTDKGRPEIHRYLKEVKLHRGELNFSQVKRQLTNFLAHRPVTLDNFIQKHNQHIAPTTAMK